MRNPEREQVLTKWEHGGPRTIGAEGGPRTIGAEGGQGEHHSTDPRTAENAGNGPRETEKQKIIHVLANAIQRCSSVKIQYFLCNGSICSERMRSRYLMTREDV